MCVCVCQRRRRRRRRTATTRFSARPPTSTCVTRRCSAPTPPGNCACTNPTCPSSPRYAKHDPNNKRERQRRGRYRVVRQTVPDGGSGDWEGPAAAKKLRRNDDGSGIESRATETGQISRRPTAVISCLIFGCLQALCWWAKK